MLYNCLQNGKGFNNMNNFISFSFANTNVFYSTPHSVILTNDNRASNDTLKKSSLNKPVQIIGNIFSTKEYEDNNKEEQSSADQEVLKKEK